MATGRAADVACASGQIFYPPEARDHCALQRGSIRVHFVERVKAHPSLAISYSITVPCLYKPMDGWAEN
jgi:hypothetical protein